MLNASHLEFKNLIDNSVSLMKWPLMAHTWDLIKQSIN